MFLDSRYRYVIPVSVKFIVICFAQNRKELVVFLLFCFGFFCFVLFCFVFFVCVSTSVKYRSELKSSSCAPRDPRARVSRALRVYAF